jgi:hypothetical protein
MCEIYVTTPQENALTLVMMRQEPVSEPPTILIPHGTLADDRRRVTLKIWGFPPPPAALILRPVPMPLACICHKSQLAQGESALIVSLYAFTVTSFTELSLS